MKQSAKRNAPIGIFDSGLGGLTVLREIIRLLPRENTIYLGDTARVPYGIRSPEVVTRYSLDNVRFLFSKGVKLLVVACNTASALSLESIKREVPEATVIGVIEPGAKAALGATSNGRIGVIGTDATIKSGAYSRAIKALSPEARIFARACPLFVPLAEEGWTENQIAALAAGQYLAALKGEDIDTLLLGCTHYPLLKKTIGGVMGGGVRLIDSGEETARAIKKALEDSGMARGDDGPATRSFYVTDSPEKFKLLAGRFLGDVCGENGGCAGEIKLLEVLDEAGWKEK
ncbi:MAG: glutamate racemase [Nitrospiraceae bacterium]|nr:glutamate racemase [Nitrospiraceae bacterium]